MRNPDDEQTARTWPWLAFAAVSVLLVTVLVQWTLDSGEPTSDLPAVDRTEADRQTTGVDGDGQGPDIRGDEGDERDDTPDFERAEVRGERRGLDERRLSDDERDESPELAGDGRDVDGTLEMDGDQSDGEDETDESRSRRIPRHLQEETDGEDGDSPAEGDETEGEEAFEESDVLSGDDDEDVLSGEDDETERGERLEADPGLEDDGADEDEDASERERARRLEEASDLAEEAWRERERELREERWMEGDELADGAVREEEFEEGVESGESGEDVPESESSATGPGEAGETGAETEPGVPRRGGGVVPAIPRRVGSGDGASAGNRADDPSPRSDADGSRIRRAYRQYRQTLDELGAVEEDNAASYVAIATRRAAESLYLLSAGRQLSPEVASAQRDDIVEAAEDDQIISMDQDGETAESGDETGDGSVEEDGETAGSDDETGDGAPEDRQWTVWRDVADWLRALQRENYPDLAPLVDDVEEAADRLDPDRPEAEQVDELVDFYESVEIVLEAMAAESDEPPPAGS